jgi:hypothetical protein
MVRNSSALSDRGSAKPPQVAPRSISPHPRLSADLCRTDAVQQRFVPPPRMPAWGSTEGTAAAAQFERCEYRAERTRSTPRRLPTATKLRQPRAGEAR